MWGNMLFYLGRMTKYFKKINQSSKAINCDWTPGVKCEVSVGSPIFTKKHLIHLERKNRWFHMYFWKLINIFKRE